MPSSVTLSVVGTVLVAQHEIDEGRFAVLEDPPGTSRVDE